MLTLPDKIIYKQDKLTLSIDFYGHRVDIQARILAGLRMDGNKYSTVALQCYKNYSYLHEHALYSTTLKVLQAG